MASNKYTQEHVSDGLPSQAILDAGLNVFGLRLFLESYTEKENPHPLKFRYLGVEVSVSPTEPKNETQQEDIGVDKQIISYVVEKVRKQFRSFGGGDAALKDMKPQFAAGVDIEDVVRFILDPKPGTNSGGGEPLPYGGLAGDGGAACIEKG